MAQGIKAALLGAGWALALAAQMAPVQAAGPQSVACSGEVTNCGKALDGTFPPLGDEWTANTAWWRGEAGMVTYDFGSVIALGDFAVSLDNNDSYRLSGSIDGNTWQTLREVLIADGSVGWGMDTFSGTASLTALRYVRVQAFDGDGLYSVGEFSTAAVPEPGAWALMAGGLAALGLRRRRAAA